MSSMPDLGEHDRFEDADPTIELDLTASPDAKALRALVDDFSEQFNDDIREDLDSTAIQEAPDTNHFSPLGEWDSKKSGVSHHSNIGLADDTKDALPDKQFEHYAEIMAIVRSYEKMLDEQYDLGISLKNYPEMGAFRLLSISVYRSGSVTLLGTNQAHMPINVYDKIDNISFAIVPIVREKKKKASSKISFFFHERPDV